MKRDEELAAFQDIVWKHFALHGRHELPWRIPEPNSSFDPYKILVSEIMLQQTQVSRVTPKFIEFITQFPNVDSLAKAPLSEVLTAWSGLGYNRRAKFLWQAAQKVSDTHAGIFPEEIETLVLLPGVGKNTAAAIRSYAFNQPATFIETNIRTAYIYHFFSGKEGITDGGVLELVQATLPSANKKEAQYRTWYWALMDYGSFLKQTIGNLNKLSKSYAKQSPFEGSRRQIRGKVIRLLSTRPMSLQDLRDVISDERLDAVLKDLVKEMLIRKKAGLFALR